MKQIVEYCDRQPTAGVITGIAGKRLVQKDRADKVVGCYSVLGDRAWERLE
jgi:hypothetical protein